MSKFLDKVPDINDLEIQSRLNKLSEQNKFFNRGDNNNFFPPNSPPLPLGPSPPRLPSDLFKYQMLQGLMNFLITINFDFSKGYVPLALDPPPLTGFGGNFFPNRPSTAKTSSDVGINTIQTMSDDRLIGELERVIEKEKPKEEIGPDENIIFTLPKAPTFLDDEDFRIKQEIKKTKKMTRYSKK